MQVDPAFLEKIRKLRGLEDPRLKPSPFLRSEFTDDSGEVRQVVLRDYQKRGVMNLLQVERMILGDDTGLGKAQPTDAKVMTPTGWTTIGGLRVGDYVIGSNGRPVRVRGVFPQGIKEVFRVTMSDGSSTECCEDHLWTVRSGNTRRSGDGWRTLSLKQILSGGLLRQRGSTGRKWSIPMVEPVRFTEKELPVDPYLLGVLLGDGSMPGTISVSNGDLKLFDLIEARLPPDCKFGVRKRDGITVGLVGQAGVRNSLKKALLGLDLIGKNWTNKFVPTVYKLASVHQRVELLRGLMDTDGYVSKDGKVTQFYSSNSTLVQDFVELVQSLGGTARVASKTPVLRGKSRAKNGRLAFTVTLSLPNSIIPFHLPRKVARWRPRTKYPPTRYISKVEPSRETECVCISVEAEDNLYVTDRFIVTHNTLEILTAIGYIWLVEPGYVPIVVTRKSALYQWAAEARKFMTDMEVVIVDGEPFERNAIYASFFGEARPGRRQIAIMTYETVLKDTHPCVVRDRSAKPPAGVKKALKAAREAHRAADEGCKAEKAALMQSLRSRPCGTDGIDYAEKVMQPSDPDAEPPLRPFGWTDADDKALAPVVAAFRAEAAARAEVERWRDAEAPPMAVPGIVARLADMLRQKPECRSMLVLDEMHVLKDYRGKIHKACEALAELSVRVVGVTATPVKNRLMEFFALFRIVYPSLFPKPTPFMNTFCLTKKQKIGNGMQIPVVVGHTNEQLEAFRNAVEPFYLSRRKHEVAKELPELITRELECRLSPEQEELYDLAEMTAEDDIDADSNAADMLRSLLRVQEACDAPQLVKDENGEPHQGESSKLEAIVDILHDQPDAKVLIFCQFERMVTLIEKRLRAEKIRCVRITGKENKAQDRERAKNLYQDRTSGVNVMLITTAGSESINLQSTEHIILVDTPWSWGDYVQLTGRAVRIGSINVSVLVTHLVARRAGGGKTIDDHKIAVLKDKKRIADRTAGEALQDGLKMADDDAVKLVFDLMVQARSGGVAVDRQELRDRARRVKAEVPKRKAAARAKKEREAPPIPDFPHHKIFDIDV